MFLNRTLCDVLSDMRTCVKTLNFSYLIGLIEEAQTMGYRMEASLYDKNDIKDSHEKIKKLKAEIKDLEARKAEFDDGSKDSGS